jgi:pimeloyl-ACP methyl ester carboxylesterase
MLVDLIKTTTTDGLRLDGAFQTSMKPVPQSGVEAAILLHGVGGNFYGSTLMEEFVEPLLSCGISVLRVNTRGHDGLFTANTSQGPRRFGAAFEIVDECQLDVAAWLQVLKNKGFAKISLVGHSLGAIKAVYSAAHSSEGGISRLALLSPPRLAYRLFQAAPNLAAFRQSIAQAEALVATGQPQELIYAQFPFPLIISAASYVDKYGCEERYDILRYLAQLPCPALFLYGEKELASGGVPFDGLDRALADAARADQQLEVRVVAGADHFYNGVQRAAVEQVVQWLTTQ